MAPGNAGTSSIADQYDVDVTSGEAVVKLAQRIGADLVVIGPEVPLVLGVADAVREAGIACFGPTKDAARIEGSKAFAKDVMSAAGVRTATSEVVDNPGHLDAALDRFGPPAGQAAWVVKDDGLAAGKGVVVTADRDAARAHAASLLDSGHPVLLESFLDGPEVSLFCVVDGETVVPLLPAQDFKRVGDNDSGPNTGGMGAYAPLPWLPDSVTTQIVDEIVKPVAAELVRRGSSFSGLLYAGLAITSNGPAVVEFNCRFGDPETQAVLALLESPLGQLLRAAATGELASFGELQWHDGYAVTIVVAAENYPGRPRVGDPIHGADADGVLHAGTARATTARWSHRAGACSRSSARAPTCPPHARPPTGWPSRSDCRAATSAPTSAWQPPRAGSPSDVARQPAAGPSRSARRVTVRSRTRRCGRRVRTRPRARSAVAR